MSPSSTTSHETSTSTTATEQNTRTENHYTEQSKNTPRSKGSHRGITIRGGGPASGRPRRTPARSDRRTAVPDGSGAVSVIVSGWSGWSGC